jgi:SP family arabinose:H+ symporter-like MFS transporter
MSKLVIWSLTSALAGFLFGFDTVVISGAEQTIQRLWGLGEFLHGLALSAALWGTVLGALLGAWPTDRLGRRQTLLWIGVLYTVSAIGSAFAPEVWTFIIARFIGGVGVGISTVAAPLYISEIAPPEKRGRLAGLFQFNIVLGILVAFLSNWLLGGISSNDWRWMLGVEALPALVYTLACIRIPESPRWLLSRRSDRAAAVETLRQIYPDHSLAQIDGEVAAIEHASTREARVEGFWSLKRPILLAFFIAFFNQLSGINAILYFAPRILGLAGLDDPLMASVSIGITNLVFTFAGLRMIDRMGRRTLLLIGSFGYIASLGLCAWAFSHFAEFNVISKASALQDLAAKSLVFPADVTAQDLDAARRALELAAGVPNYRGEAISIPADSAVTGLQDAARAAQAEAGKALEGAGLLVLCGIIAFIAAHAIGQGAVIWVFIAEIFPNRFRASGQALGSFTHWFFAASLTLVFPILIITLPSAAVFGIFAGMMCLQLVWVILFVPETKGVSLEKLDAQVSEIED